MGRKRLQRAALQWGGLALVAEIWVALGFVYTFRRHWDFYSTQLVSLARSADRISQLKPFGFKFPFSAIYFVLMLVGVTGLIGWLTVWGLRDAMAEESAASDKICEDDGSA
jgi:hypothetical protein